MEEDFIEDLNLPVLTKKKYTPYFGPWMSLIKSSPTIAISFTLHLKFWVANSKRVFQAYQQ